MPLDLDLDKLKAKPPLRDVTFYVSVVASIVLAILDLRNGGVTSASLALDGAPLTVWLGGHGYLRGQSVAAAGEVAKSHAISQISIADPYTTNAPTGADDAEAALPVTVAPGETVEDYR